MGPPKVEGVAPSAASQSSPCHGRVSGCKSRRSRHFSRRSQAAKAPGLHPGIPGVQVPPSRPLSFWCGRQARHRAVNSTHEGALPSTRATFLWGRSSAFQSSRFLPGRSWAKIPPPPPFHSTVAQRAECRPHKAKVVGANPTRAPICIQVWQTKRGSAEMAEP